MTWATEMTSLATTVRDELSTGTITLRRKTPGAFNSTTQVRAKTTADTTVTAVRGPARRDDFEGGKQERVRYTIVAADLAYRPDEGDFVIDTGLSPTTRKIVTVEPSVDGKMYELDTLVSL